MIEYLVPLIFEYYAQDLAERVAKINPVSVLETAAGSGVVARALIEVLSSTARICRYRSQSTDAGPCREQAGSGFTYSVAPGRCSEPCHSKLETFDVVVCQFGVMFYPDRAKSYSEACRVLKPGGSLIFNVWDRIETNEFAEVVTAAAATVFPDDPPQFLPRTPHGYCDEDLIREELQAAGFSGAECESLEAVSSAPSPHHPAIAYCQGTPLRNEIEQRDAGLLHAVTDRAAEAIAVRFGTGTVEGRMRAHVITAVC